MTAPLYTPRTDILTEDDSKYVNENWKTWFPGGKDFYDTFWDTDTGVFSEIYKNPHNMSEEEYINATIDEWISRSDAANAVDPSTLGTYIRQGYNLWLNDFHEDLLKKQNEDDKKAVVQSRTLGAVIAMRDKSKQAKELEIDRSRQFQRLKNLYKDKGFDETNVNQYYSQLLKDMNPTESWNLSPEFQGLDESPPHGMMKPAGALTRGVGGEGYLGGLEYHSYMQNDEELGLKQFEVYLTDLKHKQINQWNWDAGNWNILGGEARLDKAKEWAKENSKALYDEYQEYIVEVAKDLDPTHFHDALNRLESEQKIKELGL